MAADAAITAHLADYLAGYCKLPAGSVTAQTRLRDDLGLDSFDVVAFLIEIEEVYGVVVNDEEGAALRTVEDAATLVAAKRP